MKMMLRNTRFNAVGVAFSSHSLQLITQSTHSK